MRAAIKNNPGKGNNDIIHLPVAPHVTARTRFASIVPEKIPFMMPHEAMALLDSVMETRGDSITMVAITGPGDPFAVPDTTLKTISLVKQNFPDLVVGLKTLGIGGERFAADFVSAGAEYFEVQVDAVKADILEKLYAWIRPGLKTLKISDAVKILLQEQRNSVPAMKYAGAGVSIVTTVYPGYNDDHVKKISEKMMELGADSISIFPYEPGPDAEVSLPAPNEEMLIRVETESGKYLPVVKSRLCCAKNTSTAHGGGIKKQLPRPVGKKVNVAVVSSSGMDVDLHLGQADNILIYGPREDGLACLLETRKAPQSGSGGKRWEAFAEVIDDCFVVLAASAGESPRKILSGYGISVILTDENIEGSVDVLYGGGKKGKKKTG